MVRKLSIFAYAILICACSGVQVSSDYKPDESFSQLKSFAWLPDAESSMVADSVEVSEIMDKRIRSAIERQLTQQQYVQQNNTPDFFVNYSVTTEDKIDVNAYPSYGGYGPNWRWGAGYGYRGVATIPTPVVTTREYQKGTLIIDIIDSKKKELLWRGLGSKRIPSMTDPEKLDKLVNQVVEKILEKFPPE